MTLNKKLIICSTVKNNSNSLNKLFQLLSEISNNFKNTYNIFVYSKSSDNSKQLISNFLNKQKGICLENNPKAKYNRIKKLEICRNAYLNYIKKNSELKRYDYLLVIDADNQNDLMNYEKIKNSIKKKQWSAIFANQKIFYYDVFALRNKKLISGNFLDIIKKKIRSDKYYKLKDIMFENFSKFFFINKLFGPKRFIEVESAFGGLGIYKVKYILKSKYESFDGKICEHVFFNKKINKKYKHMYIDRHLTNSYGINKHTINGLLCSVSNFFAKRFLKRLKLIK